MKNVKFGICEWSSPIQGPYICKFAKELGLDGFELLQGDYTHCFPTSPRVQDAYLEEAAKYGAEISAIAVNYLDDYSLLAPEEAEEKQIARMVLRKAVEMLRALRGHICARSMSRTARTAS